MKKKALRTLILDIVEKGTTNQEAEIRLTELKSLIQTLGGIVVERIIQRRGRPSAKTFLGTGKIKEAAEYAKEKKIQLIIINGILKPNQYLHLQNLFPKIKLWDRTDLILNIFDCHAATPLSQLQIKYARLQHEIPKIYAREATTLFERAGAGIGTRGPGEKGIEAEKRHIRAQIKQVKKKIETYQRTQDAQRKKRERTALPTIALVGYTNAGKSSLMKTYTKKENIKVDDALFVTLDTKIGKMWIPTMNQEILLADTIGFISDLPPTLIEAFLTTLQEAQIAFLLLHVVDISDENYAEKIKVVNDILKQLKCDHIPSLMVFNKTDKISPFEKAFLREEHAALRPIFTSPLTKEGTAYLKDRIGTALNE